ncbi:MAG: rhodanese-like domain-containing protein [Selenomonadaceae bacterium]|nr:rhodanese-like domain-containing protein [Selenomonadaceae bacterium]
MAYSLIKIFSSFVAIFFVVIMFSGCTPNYETISPEEAQKILAEEKDYILIDVRTLSEYEKKHIPGAILLPIEEIRNGSVEKVLPDKKQKILIYCWTGRRAEDSAVMLAEMGYSNVINFGGLVEWEGEVEGSEVD